MVCAKNTYTESSESTQLLQLQWMMTHEGPASCRARQCGTPEVLPASRRTPRCVCVEEACGTARATGQVVSETWSISSREAGRCRRSKKSWLARPANTLAANVGRSSCAGKIGRYLGGRGERGGGSHSRRTGRAACAIGTWMLLALVLVLPGAPSVDAINIFLTDGVERPIGGVVNVPQGPLVLLQFSGRSSSPPLSRAHSHQPMPFAVRCHTHRTESHLNLH